jgi:hypothetical protein
LTYSLWGSRARAKGAQEPALDFGRDHY